MKDMPRHERSNALLLLFRPQQLSLRESPRDLWTWEEAALGAEEPVIAVGHHEGRKVLAAWATPSWDRGWYGLKELYTSLSTEFWALITRALTLLHWRRTHRYCGVCGGPMEELATEEALRCTRCGHQVWPRISPAVIVLVTRGEEALLAHHRRNPEGVYSLLAGYVEPGESAEEAAVREVREESGVEIHRLRFVRTQPWPFPDSLMIAFHAEWKSGEPRPDGQEVTDVRWFIQHALPPLPGPGSLAQVLLDQWKRGELLA